MSNTIVVTGATGFLGGWLVASLVKHNYRVITILNPARDRSRPATSLYSQFARHCDERCIDITSYDAVKHLITAEQPDVVVHMAAVGDINTALEMPATTFAASANSTINFLEVIRLYSPTTLFLSHTTDKVYSGNSTPFEENMFLNPSHIYEVAKVAQDFVTRAYATHYDLKTITLRCGNYFGGYDLNFNRIIPYTIRQALHGEAIRLRSDGKFTRDFLYVEDAVSINMMFIERYLENTQRLKYGTVYNFSLEVELRVIDVVMTILKLMNKSVPVVVENQTKTEIPNMRLSCAKAKKELAWQPHYTLEAGLLETIESYKRMFAEEKRTQRE